MSKSKHKAYFVKKLMLLFIIFFNLFNTSFCQELQQNKYLKKIINKYSNQEEYQSLYKLYIKHLNSIDTTEYHYFESLKYNQSDSSNNIGEFYQYDIINDGYIYWDGNKKYIYSYNYKDSIFYSKDKPIINNPLLRNLVNYEINNAHDKKFKHEFSVSEKIVLWSKTIIPDSTLNITGKIVFYFDREDYSIKRVEEDIYIPEFDDNQIRIWVYENQQLENYNYYNLSWLEEKDKYLSIEEYQKKFEEKINHYKKDTLNQINGYLTQSQKEVDILSEYENNVILLDFWYARCAPCLKAMPHLQKIYEKYQQSGLVVIGANPIDAKDDIRILNKVISKNNITYPILLVDEEVINKCDVNVFPTLVLLDKNKVIRYKVSGFHEDELVKLEEEIKKLLDKE